MPLADCLYFSHVRKCMCDMFFYIIWILYDKSILIDKFCLANHLTILCRLGNIQKNWQTFNSIESTTIEGDRERVCVCDYVAREFNKNFYRIGKSIKLLKQFPFTTNGQVNTVATIFLHISLSLSLWRQAEALNQ